MNNIDKPWYKLPTEIAQAWAEEINPWFSEHTVTAEEVQRVWPYFRDKKAADSTDWYVEIFLYWDGKFTESPDTADREDLAELVVKLKAEETKTT